MKKSEGSSLTKGWFTKGNNDLKNAEIVLKAIDPPTDTICFHCQQAAEKYLKGYLSEQGIGFFKEHDLIYLLDLCQKKDPSFVSLEEQANVLNDYSVDTRYPFEEEITYSLEEAEQAFAFAKAIQDFVKHKVKVQNY